MQIIDAEMHVVLVAEARRRIAAAAALDESASTRTDDEASVILAGARACCWMTGGMRRESSERFIDGLISEFGETAVLIAAIALCREVPPGPKAWLRQACEQHAKP